MAVDVDTLQITIEAEAADAATKVDGLVESLTRLQVLASGQFGGIISSIKNLGKAAKLAMPDWLRNRQKVLGNVAKTISPKVDKDAGASVDRLTTGAIEAKQAADKLSQTTIKPEIDTEQLSIFDQKVQDMIKNANSTQVKVPTAGLPKPEPANIETGGLSDSSRPAADAIASLSTALQGLNIVSDLSTRILSLSAAIQELDTAASGSADAIERLSKVLQVSENVKPLAGLSVSASDAAQVVQKVSDGVSSVDSGIPMDTILTGLKTIAVSVEEVLTSVDKLPGAISDLSPGDAVVNGFGEITRAVDTVKNSIRGVSDSITSMNSGVDTSAVVAAFNDINTAVGEVLASVDKLTGAISRINVGGAIAGSFRGITGAANEFEAVAQKNPTVKAASPVEPIISAGGKDSIAASTQALEDLRSAMSSLEQSSSSISGEISNLGQEFKLILDNGNLAPLIMQFAKAQAQVEMFERMLDALSNKLALLKSSQSIGGVEIPGLTGAGDKIDRFAEQVKNIRASMELMDKSIDAFQSGNMDMADLESVIKEYREIALYSRLAGVSTKNAMSDSAAYAKEFLGFGKQLQSADVYAARLSGTIASMRRKLDSLRASGAAASDPAGFNTASGNLRSFEAAAGKAKAKSDEIRIVLRELQEHPIDLNADDAKKQLDGILVKLNTLKQEYGGLKLGADRAKVVSDNSIKAVQKPSSTGDTGNVIEKMTGSETAISSLKASLTSSAPLWDVFKTVAAPAVGEANGALTQLIASCPQLRIALIAVSTAIAAVRSTMNELQKAFSAVISAAKELGSAMGAQLKRDITATASALKRLAKSGAALASTGLKSIGKAVLNDVIGPVRSATKAVKTWMSSIGRIAFYRVIRSMIKAITDAFKKGTENLYEYSRAMGTAFAPAMDSLATSAQYLSNSLAAMVAPLIQVIAPAIDYIIDKFVALLNIIGKVFAALTGKSVFTQAKKQVVSYGGAAAGSLGGAADKAKELKSYLLGIDELNVIDPNQGAGSGGGGGGGGGLDYGDMFEEVEVPNDLADWANQVRDAIEAGDWRGVGKLLADKLDEIVTGWDAYGWGQKLGELINRGLNIAFGFLENFDFTNFGRKIASFLNGIFDDLDFDTLGRVLADKWNAMFDFLYGFVTSLHWERLGHSIATAINGLVDQIHWEGIGETISAGFKGLCLMLSTAIEEIDWAALGRGLATALNSIDWYGCIMGVGDILKAALEGLRDLLMGFNNTLEWDTIARRIYSGINDGFINRKIDWRGIGSEIGESFINLFNFLCNVIAGIQWYQLGVNLQTALSGVDWKAAFESFSNLVSEAINGAISTLSGFVADTAFWNEFSTALGTGIANLITGIHWGELFADMATVAVEALRTAVTAISQIASDESFWDELKTGIKTGIQTFINNKEIWLELFSSLPTILAEAISVAVEALGALTADPTFWTDLGTSIGSGINQFFQTADLDGLAEGLGKLATDILNGLSAALETIDWETAWMKISLALNSVDWGPLVDAAMGFLGEAMLAKLHLKIDKAAGFITIGIHIVEGILQGIADGIKGIGEWLNTNLVQPIVEGVKNLFGIHSPSTVFAEIGGFLIDGLLEGLTGSWGGIVEFFAGKFGDLKTSIFDAWDAIKEDIPGKWEEIKTTLSGKWEEVKTTAITKFDEVKGKINEAWENTKTDASKKWEEIRTTLNGKWEEVKTDVTTKFDEVKKKIYDTWENTKTEASKKWEEIKTTLSDKWEEVKTTATTKFDEVKAKVNEAWENTKTDASVKWEEIKTTLGGKWDDVKTTAAEKFEGVGTAIKNVWDGLVRDALQWGRDICQGIADGISNGIRVVEGAVSRVAQGVRDFIGFSEPEKGPLSDFHTYMPDMLNLMAGGIRDNAGTALGAVDDLATQMSDAFAGISVGEIAAPSTRELSNLLNTDLTDSIRLDIGNADAVLHEARELADQVSETLGDITCGIEFQSPQNMPTVSDFPDRRMPQVSSQEPQQYNVNRHEDVSVTMQSNNEMVISAILSAAQQIVTAIGESGGDVYLDGKTLLRSVEKTGRQRGANIMAGGVRG